MTREQAQRALEKLTGKRCRLDVETWGKGVSSPERRAAAEAEHARVTAEYEAAKAEIDRIIREHVELQRLYALKKERYSQREALNHARHYRKFEAMMHEGGIGVRMLGSGDTWEEVIAEAKRTIERDAEERARWLAERDAERKAGAR